MSNRRRPSGTPYDPIVNPTDPRRAGGDMVGPGGPRDMHGIIHDVRRAVLLDHNDVALVHTGRYTTVGDPGVGEGVMVVEDDGIGVLMEGRINKSTERARILFLTNTDGVAALVSQLTALMDRANPVMRAQFVADLQRHVDKIRAEGA